MAVAVHPLCDEWTDEYALYVVHHDRVSYSRPLWHFLRDCRASGRRAVLLTGPGAVLSPLLYAAMAETGALWAFRTAAGVFDARSGLRIHRIPDLWNGPADGERHPPIGVGAPVVPVVFFDIYTGDRAVSDTLVGPVADHAVGALGGGRLVRSGRNEPLASAWDHLSLTLQARAQMPVADPILGSSDRSAWVALSVGRTRDGIVERVHGGVALPQLNAVPVTELRDHVMPAVTGMLTGLVDRFRPRVALVSSGLLRVDGARLGYAVGAQPVDAPLAVLIGPRAVRDLRLDVAALSERHDLTMLGPGRVPSALVRMTGRDPLWTQLRSFVYDLDQERLVAALSGPRQEL
ncbi:MAG: DUF6177 family protein [Arachnia sp.]